MKPEELIGAEGIGIVPRALGLLDREVDSRTSGCADRYYWHYKLHDHANARAQEVSEVLARAFLYRHAQNPFSGKDRVREWALSAVRYWERLARSDGSFDEVYPFERSFCATAFSALHATETLLLLSESPSIDLAPVGRWLLSHDAPDVANQRAASAAALANLGTLLGVDRYTAAARERVAALREYHARVGHFNEYGGSDTGYESVTLSALAVYVRRARDADAESWLRDLTRKLGEKLDDSGRYRYEGQSRMTRFFYPYALAWCRDPGLEKIARGLAESRILRPSWMDDRYSMPCAVDYLRCVAP